MQSTWSRSYHNPVGTVYHAPSEADDRWSTWDRKPSPAENPEPKEIPRNYPLGYGLFNHMEPYGRRKPGVGLGAFLPRPLASSAAPPMGAAAYVPMAGGYSPYLGASPHGSQNLMSDRLKQGKRTLGVLDFTMTSIHAGACVARHCVCVCERERECTSWEYQIG